MPIEGGELGWIDEVSGLVCQRERQTQTDRQTDRHRLKCQRHARACVPVYVDGEGGWVVEVSGLVRLRRRDRGDRERGTERYKQRHRDTESGIETEKMQDVDRSLRDLQSLIRNVLG